MDSDREPAQRADVERRPLRRKRNLVEVSEPL
jgi:hypothetical protein